MKMKEESRAFKKEAINLALSAAPQIYQCRHCGHPVLDGRCCPHCNSDSPVSCDQYPCYIDV